MPASNFPDNLPEGWKAILQEEARKRYFQGLVTFLRGEERRKQTVYPARENIMRALQQVDYPKVKIVILGQDPYHGPGQAIGLSFAVQNSCKPKPPSLQNIFKELQSDLRVNIDPQYSDLSAWVKQGVLLLNTVLTVRARQAMSHRDRGWEPFTDNIIFELNKREKPVIFILWGASAIKKKSLITNQQHFVIQSPHPSPLSAYRGFFGSKPFSKANKILKSINEPPIDWSYISEEQKSTSPEVSL